MAVFITSDLHLNHDKEFIYSSRGYSTVEEMNEDIVTKWNMTIDNIDTVYVLGDIMMGNDIETAAHYWNKLKGDKKIILGNHDSKKKIELYQTCPNTEIIGYGGIIKYKGYRFYLSHYPTLCGNVDDRDLKSCTINLCGHKHTKDAFEDWNLGKIYHVELDTNFMYPYNLDLILSNIKEKMRNDF